MPCGGIYPIGKIEADADYPCLTCRKNGCELWCEEWDGPLHRKCLGRFLMTDEGQCVIHHGHSVIQHYDQAPSKVEASSKEKVV